MTITELKNYIESVCLAHKEIKQFVLGGSYNKAEDTAILYPSIFYELPYFLQYNVNPSKQVDNIQFAFNVFVESNTDKIQNDHDAISRAKEIGDAIVSYIMANANDFRVNNITAISVREYTDDSLAGMRYEWVVALQRTYCDSTDWTTMFNPLQTIE